MESLNPSLRGSATREQHHPFVAPNVRPATKCFCIAKNIMTDGSAARIDPAETRFGPIP
ncbi:hypothetical protein OKW46_002860 [Paraburkholderia sp. WSM4179]|nr:hypothetical protein [Paraburkholderia sp. WSM4179]